MILCVGLTPTVQRTMRFERLTPGAVNRATQTLVTASGKAVNVARVVTLLGGEARLVQFLGGDTGRYIARTLEAQGIPQEIVWIDSDAPTRTCTTLLPADGPTTELVEEAAPATAQDMAAAEAAALRHLPHARALCLSGSFPPGVPEDFYARLVAAARAAGVQAIVDAQRGPLKAALAEKPFLVKPNREEAAKTLGYALSGDAEADARRAVREMTAAGAEWAMVSMGPTGSLLGNAQSRDLWRIAPPALGAEVDNPIGSGDSLTAGLAFALSVRGASVPDSAAFGTACAVANCLTPTSGVIRPEDVTRFAPLVRRERIAE